MARFSMIGISICALTFLAAPLSANAQDGSVKLSMSECISTALERNYNVLISNTDIPIHEKKLGIEEAAFDLAITGGASSKVAKVPVTVYNLSTTHAVNLSENNIYAGVKQKLEQGANYEVTVGFTQSQTDSQIAGVNPIYNPSINILFTQPLLKNYGTDTNRVNIDIAKNNLGITKGSFTRKVMETIANTKDAYWRLAASRNELAIAQKSVTLAKEFAAKLNEKISAGAAASVDAIMAEAAVAEREEALIDIRQNIQDSEDQLKVLLNKPDMTKGGQAPIQTTDQLKFATATLNLDDAMKDALEKRPEISQARLDFDTKQKTLGYSENQRQWQLDLTAKATLYGIRGDSHDLTKIYRSIDPNMFDPFSGSPFNALTDTAEGRFYDFAVGLKLEFPLDNREANNKVAKSRLEILRADATINSVIQQIDLEVRSAMRAVKTSLEKIEAAKKSRELAEKKLRSENEKFDLGSTTAFTVLQFQSDLVKEETRELNALASYLRAVAKLELATGAIMDKHNVKVQTEGTASSGG